jgi:hypothetical protein
MDEEEDVMELVDMSQFLDKQAVENVGEEEEEREARWEGEDKMPGKVRYEDEHQIFLQGLMCILNFKENMQLMEVVLAKCQLEVSKSRADNVGVWHLNLVQANLF